MLEAASPDRKSSDIRPPVAGQWHMVFNDDFDGTTLDTTKWSHNYPWGHTHNHRAYVTEENVFVSDSLLLLKGENRRHPSAPESVIHDETVYSVSYTSGAINTKGKFSFTHGYVEASIAVPDTKGFWPAFWLLNSEGGWPPEVDIMEILTRDPMVLHTNYHYGASPKSRCSHYQTFRVNDLSHGFNVYGFEWTSTYMKWYLNGIWIGEAFTNSDWIAQAKDMYIIINLAIGGWGGDPDASTLWPSDLKCDWVRVWQRVDK